MNWKTKMLNTNWLIIGLIFLFACENSSMHGSRVATLPFYKDAAFTPHWFTPQSDTLASFHKISDFNLIDQEGDSVTENTFEDKIYVANFFFTFCPGICPKMTNNMAIVQEAFLDDDEVLLLSHSVTPEHDSVEILKEFANTYNIDSKKWHLVTGDRQHIYKLGRKDYFIEENLGRNKNADDFLHTENFVLIDKQKHIRGIYNGLNKTSVNQLIADIKTLKNE